MFRLQGYKATRLQGYKATRLQGYKATRLQGYNKIYNKRRSYSLVSTPCLYSSRICTGSGILEMI